MIHLVIVGCGVVGATIAYELSQIDVLRITVLDRQPPPTFPERPGFKSTTHEAATGAALGVLMGIISQKTKGRAWRLREASMRRYETLIPELEHLTGWQIPYNRQGILMLVQGEEDLAKWQQRMEIRQSQGWLLEIWDRFQVQSRCPQLASDRFSYAIYSPQDRQVDPVILTAALVEAARRNGVTFQFGITVSAIAQSQQGVEIQTPTESLSSDGVVLSAGLGSSQLQPFVDVRPVLGQAVHYQGEVLGDRAFQPAITGDDVHIVPVGKGEYWVGATVEFPAEGDLTCIEAERLAEIQQKAIAFCPALADFNILSTWSGLRPRPEGMSAPVIRSLPDYKHVWLATGHYRNGVLLAPATAQAVREMILSELILVNA